MSEFIIDAITRRAVLVQRYAEGNAKDLEQMLLELRDKVIARMTRDGELNEYLSTGYLLEDIDKILSRGFDEINQDFIDRLLEFAEDEAGFNYDLFAQATRAVPSALQQTQLSSALFATSMSVNVGAGELTLVDAFRQFGRKKTAEILQILKDGLGKGATIGELTSAVTERVKTRQTQQARTLIRTASNMTSNKVRDAFYHNNNGLIQGYEWVATLDNRTTLLCAGRDGRLYKVGKGPQPPAHWACRSTTVPVVKPEYLLEDEEGERPAIGADGVTQVRESTTYNQWLRRQPESFQAEVLGETRAALFRNGDLEISNFRDETGRTYTLEQLKQLQPLAFERAGIALNE